MSDPAEQSFHRALARVAPDYGEVLGPATLLARACYYETIRVARGLPPLVVRAEPRPAVERALRLLDEHVPGPADTPATAPGPDVAAWAEVLAIAGRMGLFDGERDAASPLFERLLDPRTRHGAGQFSTASRVADLACSFAIRRGDETVMDPACGGGAFLVRALARKRALGGERPLSELVGIDQSRRSVWLASLNLGVGSAPGLPDLRHSDFFDVRPGRDISGVDVVIGNPPYVQQEDIGDRGERGLKAHYQRVVEAGTGLKLSGRCDAHAYFWPHAATFLRDGGALCFVTSSPWLDAGYGDALRTWIARNFGVVAVIESADEPWFAEARVATSITVLQRGAPPDQPARLVQLRQPLRSLLPAGRALTAAADLRDEILGTTQDETHERFRVRVVPQTDLLSPAGPARWGSLLRRPDLWTSLRRRTRWVPLGEVARIRRGVTTGCDRFFYVDPSAAPVESRYLEPVVRSPMEVGGFVVTAEQCRSHAVVLPSPVEELAPRARTHVRRAEAAGWADGPTCASRARAGRPWYDITRPACAPLLWPKERQYRHVAPVNPERLLVNCRFYEITPDDDDIDLWGGLLNSTWVLLSSLLHGRPVGNEGGWSSMATDLRAMPVPDPRNAPTAARDAVSRAFAHLRQRPALPFLPGEDPSELDMPDRRALDDAAALLLGIDDPDQRGEQIDELYSWIADHFQRARRKEARAIANKKKRDVRN